jgi:protein-L-isoaspartate(D-aspartate) O-methyltransferase
MVDRHIVARGIRDARVLDAFRSVPREAFVPEALRRRAYDDAALPLGAGQTISQPYIVALMLAALTLDGSEKVLDVGTGSGYAAALLARLAREVYTVERDAGLARAAAERFADLGLTGIHTRVGDGTLGWPAEAPFDAIAVAAAATEVPAALREQLHVGGRLVIPVGTGPEVQYLVRIVRESADRYSEESLGAVRFVPLIAGEVDKMDNPIVSEAPREIEG